MLELRKVTKRFGTNLAVRNLDLECREGNFLVILGPAGAGKSTTLRLIAGITSPTYGELYFRGDSLEGIPPEQRNFSMVFENYALYSHLTVYENLAFPLRARRLAEAEIKVRVRDIAEVLGIGAMLDRKPGYLSGGQRQRVALGRGLIRDADIYLFDEPISHLDARLRLKIRAELKNICLEKRSTVVHVTHDYREAMALADQVAVIQKGRLMQFGSPEQVFHQPANHFVASFVGDPPMSFIHASLGQRDGSPGFWIQGQSFFIPILNGYENKLNEAAGNAKELKLGLRANQTSLASLKGDLHNIPVEIYLVESQGHRNLITVLSGKDLLQVVTPPDQTWKVGEHAWMSMQSRFLHVFSDGKAVSHPGVGEEYSMIHAGAQ